MKKLIPIILISFLFSCATRISTNPLADIKKFQTDLNAEYKDPKKTPLRGANFMNFKQHPFFPVDLKYRVNADFTKTENAIPFEIQTSSGKTKPYKEYGKATFQIDGQELTLTLYQSIALKQNPAYVDYLFLPFRDATNEVETYGGGRYMDLKIPTGNKILLDFNKSYHPLCAYNAYDYSCPIVPAENNLSVKIEAGVMYEDVYFN